MEVIGEVNGCKTSEVLGDTFTIFGNVPPVDVLRNVNIKDLIKSVKDCICKGATSPEGYILSSRCQVPIGTPKENVDAIYMQQENMDKVQR